jgi:hypothetical protein
MADIRINRPDGTTRRVDDLDTDVATGIAQVETANALYMIAGSLLRIERMLNRSEARYDEMNAEEKAAYEQKEIEILTAPIQLSR